MTAHATVHRAPGCSGLFIPKGGQMWNDHIIDVKRQSQRLIGAAILGQLMSLTKVLQKQSLLGESNDRVEGEKEARVPVGELCRCKEQVPRTPC